MISHLHSLLSERGNGVKKPVAYELSVIHKAPGACQSMSAQTKDHQTALLTKRLEG